MAETPDAGRVRLDKWLWAARFFKTRTLAADAIAGGKVDVNGERAKRAKPLQIGDTLADHGFRQTQTLSGRSEALRLRRAQKGDHLLQPAHGIGSEFRTVFFRIARLSTLWERYR